MRPFWIEHALMAGDELSPALQGKQTADVCIVGGGFTGLWSAILCKQVNPKLDIAILERDLCGAGASGRNGGCVLTWSAKFITLCRLFGESEAVRLVRASEEAVWHIHDFCKNEGIDAEMRMDGTLYTASNRAQLGSMDAVISALEAAGIRSYFPIPTAELVRRSGSAIHLGGVFSPYAATVHPGKLVRGLRRVALRMGIRIYERTPMLEFSQGKPAIVRAPAGQVQCGKLVLAMNAWMASFFPQFERTIAVVSSDMIITETCPQQLHDIGLTDGVSVLDSRTFVHYYRTTVDGRLMLGKGGNTFTWRNRISPIFDQASPYEAQLRASLQKFFPALADIPLTASWNGPSDRSVSGFPFFGKFNECDHVFYGFGYSGNGVGPSYMGAQILSSLVLGIDNAWTRSPLCKGSLGNFPPEPLRYPGAIMIRNAIRRKECAEDEDRQPARIDTLLSKFANAAGKSDKA